jgi:plasmid stabilization system protein ParE
LSQIRWTLQAAEDLEAIHEFIARDSAHYARLVVERVLQAIDQLGQFPESGRIVPELSEPSIREIVRRPYRIVYRLSADTVELLTIFHASRETPDIDGP